MSKCVHAGLWTRYSRLGRTLGEGDVAGNGSMSRAERRIEREATKPVSQGYIEMLKRRGVSDAVIRAIENRNHVMKATRRTA
jgi:hypothetical protein